MNYKDVEIDRLFEGGKLVKILLAVDGSDNSLRAAEYASKLVDNFQGSRLTILFVDTLSVQIKVKGGVLPSNYDDLAKQGVRDILENTEKIFSGKGLPYNIKILEGYDVAETICDFAREYNYDQIVMGTRGLGNIKGIVLGSVSHQVIKDAPCPVTFVK